MLVLNRYYAPVNVTSARRAFVLLFKRFAEVIAVREATVASYDLESWLVYDRVEQLDEADEADWVATSSRRILVPRIVRLTAYDRLPQRVVSFSRKNVLARDGYRCQYCGKAPIVRELTLDHVVPRSRGGRHCWTNVVACCRRCNDTKGHRELHELPMKLLTKPRAPAVNPMLSRRMRQRKYQSWRLFVKGVDDAALASAAHGAGPEGGAAAAHGTNGTAKGKGVDVSGPVKPGPLGRAR